MSLKDERKRAGFTQQELAEKSGVKFWVLAKYESGARNIDGASLDTLCNLAGSLGCGISELLESEALKNKLSETKK